MRTNTGKENDLPKHKRFVIKTCTPPQKPFAGDMFIGCVCQFADECDMTLADFRKDKKCKAYSQY